MNNTTIKHDESSIPESSKWVCHLFGTNPKSQGGLTYFPVVGNVPNWFIRFMMKHLLGCTWVNPYPAYCCLECGENVGYLGKIFKFHKCESENE